MSLSCATFVSYKRFSPHKEMFLWMIHIECSFLFTIHFLLVCFFIVETCLPLVHTKNVIQQVLGIFTFVYVFIHSFDVHGAVLRNVFL